MLKNGRKYVLAVAWSIGGNIASGSADNTVIIWNSSTGELLKTLEGHR
jgi:WD40 repeat protein